MGFLELNLLPSRKGLSIPFAPYVFPDGMRMDLES
jgi:hypothetical protein